MNIWDRRSPSPATIDPGATLAVGTVTVPIDEQLAAISYLNLTLCDCDGPVARGIVNRAIGHLQKALREQLTGPDRDDQYYAP